MQKCEKCGQTFYSDSEFKEHQMYELVEKASAQNFQLFSNLDWRLGLITVLLVKSQEDLTFEEALNRYSDYHDKFNSHLMSRKV